MERRTASDYVFDRLHADIVSLRLLPGARLSEIDVARRFEMSRQPVREAFIRLHDLDLLHVRPQRATRVRRICVQSLLDARFVRTAVEIEVLRLACERDTRRFDTAFEQNLAEQRAALEALDVARFHALDYAFHELLCRAAGHGSAYRSIAASKAQLDRLCVLSLTRSAEMGAVHDDHVHLFDCVRDNRCEPAQALMRRHLSRVMVMLDEVRASHPDCLDEA